MTDATTRSPVVLPTRPSYRRLAQKAGRLLAAVLAFCLVVLAPGAAMATALAPAPPPIQAPDEDPAATDPGGTNPDAADDTEPDATGPDSSEPADTEPADEPADEAPATGFIGGTLTITEDGEKVPVEGVEMIVRQDGAEVTRVNSDAEGRWEAEVPRGEGYTVELVAGSLPEGISLRNEDRAVSAEQKVAGLRRTINFALGEKVQGPSTAERVGTRLASGLKVGLVVGMAAIGLSLIFGVTGLVNFAHGELVTFGALIAYLFTSRGGIASLPLVVGAVIAVIAGGLLGGLMDAALFAPLRRKGTGNVALIVFTIGMSLFLRYLYNVIFDNNPRPFRQYATQKAVFLGLAPKDFVVIGVALAAMLGVGLLLQGTRLGTAMRAVSDEPDLAASSGIAVKSIIRAVWSLGGALAALGGVLFAMTLSVEWDLGYQQLLLMFAAVVLGGLGNAYGAMVGGLIVGLASEISTLWIPNDFRTAVALGVLILVLLLRPQGVLGVKERLG